MKRIGVLFTILIPAAAAPPAASAAPRSTSVAAAQVQWKKTVVDAKFRAEGAAVADVNRDGKKDILVGDVWYEAPSWKAHEIRPVRDYGDGANGYSESFLCFADDFDRDGWADLLVISMPGTPCYWYQNPRNQPGHWKQRLVWQSACNETPVYADLFGDGKKYLVMATQPEGQMCWFSVPSDLEKPWDRHPISKPSTAEEKVPGTEQFSHGLGVGDINADGRPDVLVRQGWWEQPANARNSDAPWTFHPANLGEDCANMHVADANGDGLNDVFSSSAHRKGIWWHQQAQKPAPDKNAGEFSPHVITEDFSQTHSLNFVDINGDGRKDLITGKRWWAHGPTGDVDPNAPAVLYWIDIKPKRGVMPEFALHKIDDNSGVGTQFTVADINGDRLPDIIVANKKGVHLFEQVRTKAK